MLAEKPQDTRSYTVKYLTGQETIALPDSVRPWTNYIEVKGARANNLRGIDVRFPAQRHDGGHGSQRVG